MKNAVTALCLAVAVFASAVLSALAVPPGLEKKGEMPPGFSHGKKTGWKDNYPPGWDNKSEKEKGEWTEDVQKGRKGKDLSDSVAEESEKHLKDNGKGSDETKGNSKGKKESKGKGKGKRK